MKRYLYFMFVAALFVTSCTKEGQTENLVKAPSIVASQENNPNTKTLLAVNEGVGTIYWQPAEDINVFFGTTSVKYTSTNTENVTTAAFETSTIIGSSEGASTNIWGLYPYSSDAVCNGSKVTTTIPSTQYGVPETFDKNLFPTLAHSTTKELQFLNVCGGIKFSLSRADITKITFEGNNGETLAGKVDLTFVDNVPAATSVTASTKITLTPKTGSTFSKDVNYYIITLPVSMTGGFTMTFETATQIGTFNYTAKAVTISRSKFSKKENIDTYATFDDIKTIPDGLVDMGLSVLWATCNLGASTAEDNGGYYAWGETLTKDSYTSKNYKFHQPTQYANTYALTKYCQDISNGYLGYCDNNIILSSEDDAATYILGAGWRMPTIEEFNELINNCTITATTHGWKVRSNINGNTIYFPGSGSTYNGSSGSGFGYYWTSSLYVPGPLKAHLMFFSDYNNPIASDDTWTSRATGASIRPVYSLFDSGIIDLSLDKTQIDVLTYRSQQLTATIQKAPTAVNNYIQWASSNPNVASVDYNGNVHGVSPGVATISANVFNSAISKTCTVTVMENKPTTNNHEYVDLGLSVLWAKTNIGAELSHDSGDFFAWGETTPYYSSISPLTWKQDKTNGYSWSSYIYSNKSSSLLTKYCNITSNGYNSYTDSNTELLVDDDAAHCNWGGDWHIPSYSQANELIFKCTWEEAVVNSVNGYLVTGPNGNSIFVPVTGHYMDKYKSTFLDNSYWTSTLYESKPECAWSFGGSTTGPARGNCYRNWGLVIRPVCW